MLGSLLGRLYRAAISRLFGIDALLEQRLAPLIRQQVEDALRAFVGGHAGRGFPVDVALTARVLAAASSADYLGRHMRMARNLKKSDALLEFALSQCSLEGLVLEFGVFQGKSLRYIAGCVGQSRIVYGFDSFEGLPEDWTGFQRKGRFALEGTAPRFEEPNIELVPGWFDRTLPAFLAAHGGPARFIHADADLYSSTVTILTALRERIVPGTVIVFDEYFNYPGWEHHEFRAFREFIGESGLRYEYLGYASGEFAAAVKIV